MTTGPACSVSPTPMVGRTLIAALLTLALAPTPAHAGWRIDRSQAIAEIVWHKPCGDHVRVIWTPAPRPEWGGWSVRDRCEIGLPTDKPWDWARLCSTMIHEYGHLAHFRDPTNPGDPYHSSNPRSVMSANYQAPIIGWAREVRIGPGMFSRDAVRGDPRCARRGRPYLELHGVLSTPPDNDRVSLRR